jgi:hypothetical protein
MPKMVTAAERIHRMLWNIRCNLTDTPIGPALAARSSTSVAMIATNAFQSRQDDF